MCRASDACGRSEVHGDRLAYLSEEVIFVALAIEAYEAELAKKRQGTRTDIVAIVPQGVGKARDKAAEAVGVSARYVQESHVTVATAEAYRQSLQLELNSRLPRSDQLGLVAS